MVAGDGAGARHGTPVVCGESPTSGGSARPRRRPKIRASGWKGRVVTAYRPDPVVDPEFEGFRDNVERFGALTGENTLTWPGYLAAHRNRRAYFKSVGATPTDHGHPTALTCDLTAADCDRLFQRALAGTISPAEAEQFRGQMLTEMARMSVDDASNRFLELLKQACERSLTGKDVVFLSGGLDSTIIVGVMSELMQEPVRTFSIGFEGEAAFDETSVALDTARRFGAA